MPYSTDHKAKSKERILQSATKLFCRYGFEKVSISQVMKLAKMTHGAFYAIPHNDQIGHILCIYCLSQCLALR